MKELCALLETLILMTQLALSILHLYEEARKTKPPRR